MTTIRVLNGFLHGCCQKSTPVKGCVILRIWFNSCLITLDQTFRLYFHPSVCPRLSDQSPCDSRWVTTFWLSQSVTIWVWTKFMKKQWWTRFWTSFKPSPGQVSGLRDSQKLLSQFWVQFEMKFRNSTCEFRVWLQDRNAFIFCEPTRVHWAL